MKLLLNLMLILSSFIYNEVYTTVDQEDVSEFLDEGETVTKIDEAKYKQGIEFTKDLFLLKHNYDYHLTKVIGLEDHSYFLIGRVDTGYYPFRTENLPEFPYLAYYQNEELVWEKVFTDWGYGCINHAIIDDNHIVVIGFYEVAGDSKKIVIAKFGFDGALKDKILLGGSKASEGQHIFAYQSRYYFTGITFANDGDFYTNESNHQNIVVGFVNQKNFQIKEVNLVGNEGNNRYFGAQMQKDNIYIYMQFDGNGYFVNNDETNFRAIVHYDYRLEYQNYIPVDDKYRFKTSELIQTNDSLAIVSHDYWDDGLMFSFYDWGLNFMYESKLKLSNQEGKFYDYTIDIGDYITICCNFKKEETYQYKFFIFTNDWQIIHQTTRPSTVDDIPVSVYLINHIIYCGSTTKNKEYQQPYLESHLHIKINDSSVAFNGIYLSSKALTSPTNQNTFGETTSLYAYCSGDYRFILPLTIIIPARINIANKEIYDYGLTLDFNGAGYLNGEEIHSGYICNQEGTYLLELQGVNQTLYYTFTITKKSFGLQEITTKQNIEFQQKYEFENPEETSKTTINFKEPSQETMTSYLYILLSLAIIGIIIGFLLPQRRKKND